MPVPVDHSLADGLAMGMQAGNSALMNRREQTMQDARLEQMAIENEGAKTRNKKSALELDNAQQISTLGNAAAARAQSGQMLAPGQTLGISQPSQDQLQGGGYGGTYGPQAVQEAVGDNYRENNRFGTPSAAPPTAQTVPYGQAGVAGDALAMSFLKGDATGSIAAGHAQQLAKASELVTQRMAQVAQDPSYGDHFLQQFSQSHPELGITPVVGRGGFTTLSFTGQKGAPAATITLSPYQKNALISAEAYMSQGLVPEGMAMLKGVDESLAAHVAGHVAAAQSMATVNNHAASGQATADYQQGELGVRRAELGIKQQQLALDMGKGGVPITLPGGAEAVQVMILNKKTGQLEPQVIPLPPGAHHQKQFDVNSILANIPMYAGMDDPDHPGQKLGTEGARAYLTRIAHGFAQDNQPGAAALPAVTPPPRKGGATNTPKPPATTGGVYGSPEDTKARLKAATAGMSGPSPELMPTRIYPQFQGGRTQ